MVEHSAFKASQVLENDTGVVVLQIPFGVQKFLPKEERASTFSDFPCFQQTPGSFLLLLVFATDEITRAISSSSDRSFSRLGI